MAFGLRCVIENFRHTRLLGKVEGVFQVEEPPPVEADILDKHSRSRLNGLKTQQGSTMHLVNSKSKLLKIKR